MGNEKQYGEFKRLSIEQKIAEENLAALDWPGTWPVTPPYGWPWMVR